MKKSLLLTAVFFIAFSFIASAGNGLFDFFKNDDNKPSSSVLVIFYKEDCPYCQSMDAALKQDDEFSNLLRQRFNIQKIDIKTEEGRALADKFNVHSVPTVINFDVVSGGQQTIKGFPGINKLAALLNISYTTIAQNNPVNKNSSATCGDGIVEAGESCDDGNITIGDGCNSTCNIELGFTCFGSPSVCTSTCGDGIKTATEGCDDGNLTNADGCSSSCTVEPGYSCSGSPSVCVLSGPVNDECAGAIVLAAQFGNTAGNNTTATNSSVAASSCQANWQKDLWYRFTLTAARPVTIAVNGGTMTDPVLAIYSGSCGALVQVGCDDDAGPGNFSFYTASLAAGTYYIRVMGFGVSSSAGIGTFTLAYNFNASCGNGITEFGEDCDDGNINNGDGCSFTCNYENPSALKGISINEDGTRSNPSAMLDVKSDNKGVLIPRLTTAQRTAITTAPTGLVVFDITTGSFWFYKASSWFEISSSFGTGFSAYNGTGQAFSSQFIPVFPVEQYDDGNNFSSNVFTVPAFGLYDLSSYATFTFTSAVAQTVITLEINNPSTFTTYSSNSMIIPAGFSGTVRLNTSMSTKLNAASTVGIRILVSGAPGTQQLNSITFSGFRLY